MGYLLIKSPKRTAASATYKKGSSPTGDPKNG